MSPIMTIDADDVLLIIDIQNDFLRGGALAVPGGDVIVPIVNRLVRVFAHVVVTQDWHPEGHASFASSHEGAKPFDVVRTPYGEQPLWPDHCVQGAPGAELHEELDVDSAFLILRKGVKADVDSYSAFAEADGKTTTGLAALLKARGARRVRACGLATDYCVTPFRARRSRRPLTPSSSTTPAAPSTRTVRWRPPGQDERRASVA